MHPSDPVNLSPIPPLTESYVYHSEPYAAGPSTSPATAVVKDEDGWIMGIDEAGRGPVLGPMVYAAAYCPKSFQPTLEGLGFDGKYLSAGFAKFDSKALSPETRQSLWEAFTAHPPLCYSSSTLSPQTISAHMLRRVPINLNRQAEDATTGLIQSALDRGIRVTECYVDALGPAPQWQARLSAMFPNIKFTVCPKADSLFKIVGAASIVAKVTRDRYVEQWRDPEDVGGSEAPVKRERMEEADAAQQHVDTRKKKARKGASGAEIEASDDRGDGVERGSGYPSDPKTQAYLKDSLNPVFGYKGIVRFSWATVKVILEKQGVECKWIDDTAQPSAASWFGAGADNGRPKIWRDLGVVGVSEL